MQINFYFQRTPSKFSLDAVPTPQQPANTHALCSEQTHSSRVNLCWAKALNYVVKEKKMPILWAKQQTDLHRTI